MRKCITIGGKIGYLNSKNGRYMWANIVGMDGEFMTIKTEVKITRGKTLPNVYKEAIKEFKQAVIENSNKEAFLESSW